MNKKDLETTKPIKILSDLADSRSNRYDKVNQEVTRSEKYEDILIEEEAKEQEEIAEEALAEKNIALAEELLSQENVEGAEVPKDSKELNKKSSKVDDEDDEITEDDGLTGKLIVKWRQLPKKKKNLIIVGVIVGLLLLIALIVFLILMLTSKEEKPVDDGNNVVEEEIPVVVDNFYYKDGKLYFLKDDDSELGSYECTNKDDKLCYVDTNLNRDDFDIVKLEAADGSSKSQRLPIYDENYVFVFDNKDENSNEIVLYSIKENKEIARYLDVKAYNDNYVIVKNKDEQYGLIQISGDIKEVIKPQYSYLGMIEGENNLIAKSKKGYAVISKSNKVLSSYYDSKLKIKNYNDNYVVTLVGDDYSVYDYKGNLVDTGFEFITILNKYVVLIDSKKLFIKDVNGTKYTESGIKLYNSNYVKTYVYDENDQLTSTKVSFELNIKSDNIEVVVYPSKGDESTYYHLSIVEALANNKYDYVNYFDKKLYFYSDSSKKELIGVYSCNNENSITKSDDEYTSCFVAVDTIMEDNDMISALDLKRKSRIPIINNQYVFIKDGNNTINLYNLVDKNTEVTYLKVNTMSPNNDNKVTHYNGNLEAIVQTKSGKYGVISFDGSSVSKLHSFEYNSIEKLGDYYLALDTSSHWRVLYHGSESVGFTNKVRGYNSNKTYFKILDNGKYYVYDKNGDKAISDSYSYVELYDNYFAGVNSSKELTIYDYEGNVLSKKVVTVGNYSYYGTDNPAFTIKKNGDDFIVSLWDGSKYNDINVSEVEEDIDVE
ncbi:MAG: hypothetical protein ACI4XM_07375 [Candidatus Coprovivens sp.]